MPIYRCNQCSFVSEDTATPVGEKIACARCGTPSVVYGTVFYVEKLVERYFAALREVKALQAPDTPDIPVAPPVKGIVSDMPILPKPLAPGLADMDSHNTDLLATAEQHAPIKTWFAARQIEASFNHSNVDTRGFFDDAASQIGEQFALFAELIDRICYAYRNSQTWVNLELGGLSQKDAQAVNTLCRTLYEHTFFAYYKYQKQEKIVRLTLQPATNIRQFFDGGWLEWYVFMVLLKQFKEQASGFSCARGTKVTFANEDLHELDVFFLPQGQAPICIECKSGEFRRDIDKYLRLRKRLGIDRSRFILCAADLTDEQAAGLTAMYELTFVNLASLGKHVASLV
jgi:hypothetical protein